MRLSLRNCPKKDEEFDMIKITRQIAEDVADSGVQNGVVFVISLHTTTGIIRP